MKNFGTGVPTRNIAIVLFMANYILSSTPKRGLIRIVHLLNGKTFLTTSEDIAKEMVRIRFQLDMEEYPHLQLQQEYTQTGLELFSIEPYLVVENAHEDLEALRQREENKLRKEGVLLY